MSKIKSHKSAYLFLIVTASLAFTVPNISGCSDGGSRSALEAPPVDLDTSITFPPNSAASGGVDSLAISGLVGRVDGLRLSADNIDSVMVNGVKADIDYDTGRWQVTISLPPTENIEVLAETLTPDGSRSQAKIGLNNLPVRPDYRLIQSTLDGTAAIVSSGNDLRVVDLESGEETFLVSKFDDNFGAYLGIRSTEDQSELFFLRRSAQASYDAFKVDRENNESYSLGSMSIGPYIYNTFLGFDLDEMGRRLLLSFQSTSADLDADSCDLREIDVETGVNSTFVLTGPGGESPNQVLEPFCPGAVLVDPATNQVLVTAKYDLDPDNGFIVDTQQLGIYGYDLYTRLARVVSDSRTGSGPALNSPEWLFASGHTGQLLAVDSEFIHSVDIATGNRELVLEKPDLPELISDMDYDSYHQRLLIARDSKQVLSLSLADGSLEQLLSRYPPVGSGVSLDASTPSVFVESSQSLYNIDSKNNQLLSMRTSDLHREVLAAPILQENNELPFPVAATAFDDVLQRLYFSSGPKIFSIDPDSGQVEALAPIRNDQALQISTVSGLGLDPEGQILYVSAKTTENPRTGIVSIDLNTDEWRVLAEGIPGSTNDLIDNIYDPEENRVLAVQSNGDVVAIDVFTGSISVVARSDGQPNDLNLGVVREIAFDALPGKLLLGYGLGLVSVDISSGERALVSDSIRNISVDRSNGVVYGTRSTMEVIAMDRISGEIATVSREQ